MDEWSMNDALNIVGNVVKHVWNTRPCRMNETKFVEGADRWTSEWTDERGERTYEQIQGKSQSKIEIELNWARELERASSFEWAAQNK